ncbi:MAG TPA: hypothetical protein VGG39_11950 [Polyangiaceae bacterium]
MLRRTAEQVAKTLASIVSLVRSKKTEEGLSQLVAQAIKSHNDPKMHPHDSTIPDAEKTGALARVIRLFPAPPAQTSSSPTPFGVAARVADPPSENSPHVPNPAESL